jgi:hypothetical protein
LRKYFGQALDYLYYGLGRYVQAGLGGAVCVLAKTCPVENAVGGLLSQLALAAVEVLLYRIERIVYEVDYPFTLCGCRFGDKVIGSADLGRAVSAVGEIVKGCCRGGDEVLAARGERVVLLVVVRVTHAVIIHCRQG